MEQCSGCGAALPATAQWCAQCYLPRSNPPVAAPAVAGVPLERSIMAGTNHLAANAPPPPMVKTRWRKTPTTFGPVGRVSWTAFLVVVLLFFVAGAIVTGGFDLIGLGAWGFVIMPLGLRDIWKAGSLPAR